MISNQPQVRAGWCTSSGSHLNRSVLIPPGSGLCAAARLMAMAAVNPKYILRNHHAKAAIDAAEKVATAGAGVFCCTPLSL